MSIPRIIGTDFGGPGDAAAAAARTVPGHLGRDTVERGAARTRRPRPRRRLGPARPRPQARAESVHDGRAGRRRAGAGGRASTPETLPLRRRFGRRLRRPAAAAGRPAPGAVGDPAVHRCDDRHPGRLARTCRDGPGSGIGAVLAGAAAALVRRPGFVERQPDMSARHCCTPCVDTDPESYAQVCEALAGFDVSDRLHEIGVPVLAMAGSRGRRHAAGVPAAHRLRRQGRSARRARRCRPPRARRGARPRWPN